MSKVDEEMVIISIVMDDVSLCHVGDKPTIQASFTPSATTLWVIPFYHHRGLAMMDDVSFCHVENNLLFKLVSHLVLGLCGFKP